jgi:di/tricarboxylate transporter
MTATSWQIGFVFVVLALALALFVWGRWRYDLVALAALLAVAMAGIVPAESAFSGFGHPAVITVAAVLILSRGLRNAGVVDVIAGLLLRAGSGPVLQVTLISLSVALLSGFMNNVGALALLLPVTIQMARKSGNPPSLLLMPLAFGSLLGGLFTLIGTPPNIIVAAARADGEGRFRMFDFAPVGLSVMALGVAFIALLGWRLVPRRKGTASREELFHIEDYTTELRVTEKSAWIGKTVGDMEESLEGGLTVAGLARGKRRLLVPSQWEALREGDILIAEGDSDAIKALTDKGGLKLAGSGEPREQELQSDEIAITEAVVRPESFIVGRTASSLLLRTRYGVNLLAVARHGRRLKERLARVRLRQGDILLLQGQRSRLGEAIGQLGCLPLAERELRIGKPRRVLLAVLIFAAAVVSTVSGLLAVEIAFVLACAVMILGGFLSLTEAYESVDWPVIVLLAAMIPVGEAMEITGGSALLAQLLLKTGAGLPPAATLAILLMGTMAFSNIVNNAAIAVVMAPIAVSLSEGLHVSADPFLMAVALGASSAFLTPIGHQSNTLVMGPGGYEFGDYWKLGLPLSLIVVAAGVPLILRFWPLS